MLIGMLANVCRMLLLLAATRVSWPCSRGINLRRKKNSWESTQSSRMLEPNAKSTKAFVGGELGRLRSWNSGHSLSVSRKAIVFCKILFYFSRRGKELFLSASFQHTRLFQYTVRGASRKVMSRFGLSYFDLKVQSCHFHYP
jgi:hypothetical protein